METRKLYYEDSHLRSFQAVVQTCTEADGRWALTLDATAFYPEGGGQAGDTGTLNDIPVRDTREENGQILHLCAAPLAPGTPVNGVIDYDARFLRMQQHSGEHIVSGILHRRYGCSNIGFHMGLHSTQIDFDAVIPAEALPDIEREANAAVWQDLAVKIWTPSEEELAGLSYRTKRALPWPVRIVEFPGYDRCACCGTHVSHTGEIGFIKLFSAIPCRGGTRIEMACGKAALDALNDSYRQCRTVSQICSVPMQEASQGVQALAAQLGQLKYEVIRLQRLHFADTARQLVGKGNVLLYEQQLNGSALRELADAAADVCGGIAAVFSENAGKGLSYCLISRSEDLRAFGKEMHAALPGRGGGKPECQQGTVQADLTSVLAYFRRKGFVIPILQPECTKHSNTEI